MPDFKKRANELLANEYDRECSTCAYWQVGNASKGMCKAMTGDEFSSVTVVVSGDSFTVLTDPNHYCKLHSFI